MKLFYKLFLTLFLIMSLDFSVQAASAPPIWQETDSGGDFRESYGSTFEGEAVVTMGGVDVDNPDPVQIVDVIETTLAIAISVVGVVFIAMVGYGAIKSAMAAGDPRGLQAGKSTWTNAFFGFMIIILVYIILNIAVSLMGGSGHISMTAVFDMLRDGISEFLIAAGIYAS